MNRRRIFALAIVSALTLTAVAHAKLRREGEARVQFTATGPAGLSIVGTSSELMLSETDTEFVVIVPLDKLDTKIALRNKHMREKYLQVDKYPNAELRVAKNAVRRGAEPARGSGQLTLHGRTRTTPFSYTAKPDGSVTGALRVNMSDFGIEQPRYAGMSVKPEVDVTVTFRAADG